ncbi:hypothetical protein EJI00_04695 [Variovorax sp. DXTD-1]|nr:hypothetical protein EJI00_04695 [Variovorax sp. DXTD-1]
MGQAAGCGLPVGGGEELYRNAVQGIACPRVLTLPSSLPRWGRAGVGARRPPNKHSARSKPAPIPAFPQRGKEQYRGSPGQRCGP